MSARASCWAHAIIKAGVLENTVSPKLVLLDIADRSDQIGKSSPSSGGIAKGLHISNTTVKTAIRYLSSRGVLDIIHRKSEVCDDVNLSNIYILKIPKEFAVEALPEGVGQISPHPGKIRRGARFDPVLKSTESKSKSKSKSTHAPADAGAAAAHENQKKARGQRPSGLVTWTSEDIRNALRIEQEEPPEQLREAIAEARRRGKEPLPGSVSLILRERAVASAAAEATARAAARCEQIEWASRARADRELAELMALQARSPDKPG